MHWCHAMYLVDTTCGLHQYTSLPTYRGTAQNLLCRLNAGALMQGVGKTTAAGKLAKKLAGDGEKVLMTSCDVYRPAAIDQLEKLSKQVCVRASHLGICCVCCYNAALIFAATMLRGVVRQCTDIGTRWISVCRRQLRTAFDHVSVNRTMIHVRDSQPPSLRPVHLNHRRCLARMLPSDMLLISFTCIVVYRFSAKMQVGVDFRRGSSGSAPAAIAAEAKAAAVADGYDAVLVDTAGRLQVRTAELIFARRDPACALSCP